MKRLAVLAAVAGYLKITTTRVAHLSNQPLPVP